MRSIEKHIELIDKWNDRLNTSEKILHQVEVLKGIILKRKKEGLTFMNIVKCNGYIIAKILQNQGTEVNFTNDMNCYYLTNESTDGCVKIMFKDSNGNKTYYDITP